jgi:hypothetical protein
MNEAAIKDQIARVSLRLERGGYKHPDDYYGDKDTLRQLRAKLAGKHEHEVDPMGFWFGRMSN